MCLGAIYWARPLKVYFAATKNDAAQSGFDDDFIYNEINMNGEERSVPFINKERELGLEAFKLWDKSDLKIDY